MTREEAIKEIKSWDFLEGKELEAIGTLIPELKELIENEDERIYKEIMEFFKMNEKKICVITNPYPKWIAWLEKQKENLEKQKEQKPVEWDEDTKMNLDRAIQIIKKAKGTLRGYQSDDGIYECDKAIECLEHFLYRGLEIEKTVEWSEEDEKMLADISWAIRYCAYNDKKKQVHDWFENRFKSLRPQPKQEWSEVEFEFRGEKVKVKRPFFRDDKGRGYSTTKQDDDVAWYALRAWCEKKGVSLYDLIRRGVE